MSGSGVVCTCNDDDDDDDDNSPTSTSDSAPPRLLILDPSVCVRRESAALV